MNRRQFLAFSSLAAALPLRAAATMARNPDESKREFYELRLYHMLLGQKKKLLNDFLRDAAIPAMNRIGIRPVGVFNVVHGPNKPTLYVLLPYPSLESLSTATTRLFGDSDYRKDGATFINASLSDPLYHRTESSLMIAFEQMSKLELPPASAAKDARIFELRIYESHSVKAAQKKIEMFNEGGEITIFRKTGLRPVFFGETLVGTKLPNLTYMIAFKDMADREKTWDRFRNSPDWKKLRADPAYADTVSNITSIILLPAPYSQI